MNLSEARQAGTAGLDLAYQRSLFETPDWATSAKEFFRWYCQNHWMVFVEDVSDMYAGLGMPLAANEKAWGQIVRHAAKEGWISRSIEVRARRKGHGAPAPVWISQLRKIA